MIDFESVLKTQPDIDAVNTIAGFLAGNNEVSIPQKQDVDLVIHAGNAVLQTAEGACFETFLESQKVQWLWRQN